MNLSNEISVGLEFVEYLSVVRRSFHPYFYPRPCNDEIAAIGNGKLTQLETL